MMEVAEKMKNRKNIQVLTGDDDNDFAGHDYSPSTGHGQCSTDLSSWGHHGDIKEMATMMIEDQNKEITDLSAWLKSNGAIKQ
jgi:hypothetical protein